MTANESSSIKGKDVDAGPSKPNRSSTSLPSDEIHKQSFSIKDLAADYVTLYPWQAQIQRNIENVRLKPGRNEITITDLTNYADENSIKVEGKGDAMISDMTVDRVLRAEDDELESESESDTESESSDNEEQTESESEDEALKQLTEEIHDLESQISDNKELQASAAVQLQSLQTFGGTLDASNDNSTPDNVEKFVSLYNKERARLYAMHSEAQKKLRDLQKELDKKRRQKRRQSKATDKANAKKLRAKQKKQTKAWKKRDEKDKRRQSKRDEKERKKREGSLFKPTHSFQVKILVEGTKIDEEASLKMTYIVRNAGWIPHYDLKLDSVSKSGQIRYRAEFKNQTWENWKDAKITLSTSATTFTGLYDTVPTLASWALKLGKGTPFAAASDPTRGLYSLREQEAKNLNKPGASIFAQNSNNNNIMMKKGGGNGGLFGAAPPPPPPPQQQQVITGGLFGQSNQVQQASTNPFGGTPTQSNTGFGGTSNVGGGLFAQNSNSNSSSGGGLFGSRTLSRATGFGSAAQAPAAAPAGPRLFGSTAGAAAEPESFLVEGGVVSADSAAPPPGSAFESAVPPTVAAAFGSRGGGGAPSVGGADEGASGPPTVVDDDVSTLTGERGPMAQAESTTESHGMTTTYDIPGIRTIVSSPLTRRHLISTIELPSVEFSSVVVPKLRPVAFLKARVKNMSKLTLLRGACALTVDGSFLGNTTLPKVFPDQHFSLGLGTDPAITVTYAKPTRKTSSQGVFNKEETTVYTRSVFLHNAKSTQVHLIVQDQIPVSEDEKLRIKVVNPKGLKAEGDSVKVPTSSVLVGKKDADGGDAASTVSSSSSRVGSRASIIGSLTGKDDGISVSASLKKAGEIQWDVKLEKGRMCRVPLEYEIKIPAGEIIYAAN